MDKNSFKHPRSLARENALKFLYQCECERLYHFAESHFIQFVQYMSLPSEIVDYTKALIVGYFEKRTDIDLKVNSLSQNWKLVRMPATDRSILRIATLELMLGDAPEKVIINEAIELAKKYGTKQSPKFVNAVLDRLAKQISQDNKKDSSEPSDKASSEE